MKILYVTTISNTVNAFLIPHIRMLISKGHQVDVAFNVVQEVSPELVSLGCRIHLLEFQRSPLNKQNYTAYKKLKKLIQEQKYEVVHTHTPVASACVRLACRKMKNVKVMYTAHGFHFFKGAPLRNWLFYYPVERFLSRFTDILITINKEDYERALNIFHAKKVLYIQGVGLDLRKFTSVVIDKKIKREELGIPSNAIVLISVGEINKNKNHEVIIRAIAKLNKPEIYYVLCGIGERQEYLQNLADSLAIADKVRFLRFRTDIAEIYKVADIFAFPSRREGLGLAALEAMASGLPLITSDVHGIVDYSISGVTGFNCRPNDVNGFASAIEKFVVNKELSVVFGQNNLDAVKRFDINNVLFSISNAYKDVTEEVKEVI